jgi:hypothetical protein
MMRAEFPYSYRWLAHIDDMSGVEGEWEDTIAPVVTKLVRISGEVYAPFLLANAAAAQSGAETFAMTAMSLPYQQGTFKYQVKCLADLRARYAALDGDAKALVDPVLGSIWLNVLIAQH